MSSVLPQQEHHQQQQEILVVDEEDSLDDIPPRRKRFSKINRMKLTRSRKTPPSKPPSRIGTSFAVMLPYQLLMWLRALLCSKVLHFSQGRGARPSKPAAIMCFAVLYSMLPCCDAADGWPPNAARIELKVILLLITLAWIFKMLYLLVFNQRVFLCRLRQPEVPALPNLARQHPTPHRQNINWRATASANENGDHSLSAYSDPNSLSYHYDISASSSWCNSAADAYGEHLGGAKPAADPRQYPHGIQARRLEDEPDVESMVVSNNEMPRSSKDTRSRRSSGHVMSSISSRAGSMLEIGIGIAHEDNTVSFNCNVEPDMSNTPSSSTSIGLSPSANMDNGTATQQENGE